MKVEIGLRGIVNSLIFAEAPSLPAVPHVNPDIQYNKELLSIYEEKNTNQHPVFVDTAG